MALKKQISSTKKNIQALLQDQEILHAKLDNNHDQIMEALTDAATLVKELTQLKEKTADLAQEEVERSIEIISANEGQSEEEIQTRLEQLESEIDEEAGYLLDSIADKEEQIGLKIRKYIATESERSIIKAEESPVTAQLIQQAKYLAVFSFLSKIEAKLAPKEEILHPISYSITKR